MNGERGSYFSANVNCIATPIQSNVYSYEGFRDTSGISVADIAVGYVARYKIKDHPGRCLVYRPAISVGIEIVVIFL